MSIKTKSIGALFVVLLISLAVNPMIVHNIYGSILGRLFLISIVVFFSMNNITLGLLLVLTIVTALNQFSFFAEGMENGTPTTIGEENINIKGKQKVLTASSAKKTLSDFKKDISDGTIGINKEAIETAIMPKDSKQIPVDLNMNSSLEVDASSSGMLNPNSATLEGFSSYAKLY
jgi:uncharacterized protein (UPF0333 family)